VKRQLVCAAEKCYILINHKSWRSSSAAPA